MLTFCKTDGGVRGMSAVIYRRKQTGLSIVELMVGAAVALIVVTGGFAFYMSTVRSGLASQRQLRLTQEARAVMDILLMDVRRAGYWANAQNGGANPFTVRTAGAGTDLFVQNNCLLFTYDATFLAGNTPGSVTTGYDYFGYQLSGTNIQMLPDKTNYTDTSRASCAGLSWQNLTDGTDVKITSMASSVSYKCLHQTTPPTATQNAVNTPCNTSGDVETRTVTINLTAESAADSNTKITLNGSVLLPNQRIVP